MSGGASCRTAHGGWRRILRSVRLTGHACERAKFAAGLSKLSDLTRAPPRAGRSVAASEPPSIAGRFAPVPRRPPPHAGLARPLCHRSTLGRCRQQLVASLTDPETTSPERRRPHQAFRIRHWGRTALPFATSQPPAMPSGPKPTRPTAAARIATRFAPREPDQRRTQGAWPASSRASPRNSFDPCARRPAAPDLAAPAAKGERHGKAYGGCRFLLPLYAGRTTGPARTRQRGSVAHHPGGTVAAATTPPNRSTTTTTTTLATQHLLERSVRRAQDPCVCP